MSNTTSCTINKPVSLFPLPNNLSDGAKFPLETDLDKMVSSMLLSVQTQSTPLSVVPIGTTSELATVGSIGAVAATSPVMTTIAAPVMTTTAAPLNVVPIGTTTTEPAPIATSTVLEAPMPQPIIAEVTPAVEPVVQPTVIPTVSVIPPAEDVKVGETAGEPLIFNPITPNATTSSVPKVEGFRSNLKQKLGLSIEGFSNVGSLITGWKIVIVVIIFILLFIAAWFFGLGAFLNPFYRPGSFMGRRGFF